MKSLLSSTLVVIVFFMSCFACAPSYDTAQWAKNVKPKKANYGCINAKKPKKKKGYR